MRNLIERTEGIVKAVVAWAAAHNAIRAIALVGSRARGAATPNSDIDLVLLVIDTEPSVPTSLGWMPSTGNMWACGHPLGETPNTVISGRAMSVLMMDWKWSLASPPLSWTNCAPLNSGTKHVVSDGCRVLYDPDGRLAALMHYLADAVSWT